MFWSKTFYFEAVLRPGITVLKKEIWFMFNCQTKREIVPLFIYPEIPPCRVFLGGPVIQYLFVYTIAQSHTIPAQSPFSPHNLLPITRTIFFFFPHPVRRPVYCIFSFQYFSTPSSVYISIQALTSLHLLKAIVK